MRNNKIKRVGENKATKPVRETYRELEKEIKAQAREELNCKLGH